MSETWRGLTLHPLILGLLQSLPPPGSIWPRAKRTQWLLVAESCLNLLYHDDPDEARRAARQGGDQTE